MCHTDHVPSCTAVWVACARAVARPSPQALPVDHLGHVRQDEARDGALDPDIAQDRRRLAPVSERTIIEADLRCVGRVAGAALEQERDAAEEGMEGRGPVADRKAWPFTTTAGSR